jgi:imidazole glycerol-phosphate synthase subunit HisH
VIAVLDYGIGNLRSAEKALQHLGADALLIDDPERAAEADGVVLPGVGAFGRCAEALRSSGLDRATFSAVERGVPFLGICVGFQLLYEGSDEDPSQPGLGILPGVVRRLPPGVKHPQMQWNLLDPVDSSDRVDRPDRTDGPDSVDRSESSDTASGSRSGLLAGLPAAAWVYFVHSYAPELGADTSSTCEYGGPVTASAERGPVWGTQFHPEKSGAVGLGILSNFVGAVHDAER